MSERLDPFNTVVTNHIVRQMQHEYNCKCFQCISHAKASMAWLNENRQYTRANDRYREEEVIRGMAKVETQEQLDSRMMNMLGEPDIERMLAMVGQNYGELLGTLEGDPGDEQFFG